MSDIIFINYYLSFTRIPLKHIYKMKSIFYFFLNFSKFIFAPSEEAKPKFYMEIDNRKVLASRPNIYSESYYYIGFS